MNTLTLFLMFAIPLSAIDLSTRRLPHWLTLPAVAAGIFLSWRLHGTLKESLLGALVAFGIMGCLVYFFPGKLGGGDVVWSTAIGAFVGVRGLPPVMIVASLFGMVVLSVMSMAGMSRKKFSGKTWRTYPLPFGPFLSAGGIAVLVIQMNLCSLSFCRHFFDTIRP